MYISTIVLFCLGRSSTFMQHFWDTLPNASYISGHCVYISITKKNCKKNSSCDCASAMPFMYTAEAPPPPPVG